MKCFNCSLYKVGYMYNACAVTGDECFRAQDDCHLVNEDGSINYDDPFFKNNEASIQESEDIVWPD